MVWYGTSSGNYTTNTTSTLITSYTQTYNFSNANPILNYSSPLFHHVTIQNLAPSTLYYYKCGDPTLGMSQELNFTSPPAVGPTTYPFVLGVVADTGLTPNTTVTIQHLTDAKPQVWTLIGDFTYADDMQTNGMPAILCTLSPCLSPCSSAVVTVHPAESPCSGMHLHTCRYQLAHVVVSCCDNCVLALLVLMG